MLISILDPKTERWRIEEYLDNINNDNNMFYTEKWKADIEKASDPSALQMRSPVYVSRGTPQNYDALLAEGSRNCFSRAFLEAAKTIPVHNQVIHSLQSGQSPYEVIEALTATIVKQEKEIQDMVKAKVTIHY